MRVKIMLPLLRLLLLLDFFAADRIVGSETGSRSSSSAAAAAAAPASVTNRGQASARERDFRPSSLPWPDPTSVYKSADIGDEHLIGGRVTFFTPDDFIWKRRSVARRKKRRLMKTWNSKTRPGGQVSKRKERASEEHWIDGDVDRTEDFLKMHAFIVRDEDVPNCGNFADKVTKTRYFMCSGAILNEKHVLTSATCMNRAQIYEHHIDAELAVLIGALDENSYVIKIAHYEIHPRYVPNPNAIHHATNNVAVLTLSCSISLESAVIPKLPFNTFDNVGHMCCPDRCKLLTVIENSNNQHTIKPLTMKHLPWARHIDGHSEGNNEKIHKNRINSTNSRITKQPTLKPLGRKIRKPEETPPLYLTKGKADKIKSKEHSDKKDLTTPLRNAETTDLESSTKSKDTEMDWELVKKEIMANNVTTENKEKLSNFMKNSMSDIITKTLESMTEHVARIDNTYSYFNNILEKNTPSIDDNINEKVSELMGKEILKLALRELHIIPKDNNSQDENLKNKEDSQLKHTQKNINTKQDGSKVKGTKVDKVDSKIDLAITNTSSILTNDSIPVINNKKETNSEAQPSNTDPNIKLNDTEATAIPEENLEKEEILEHNVHCPPLGSPIIFNNTLVALIAYTCDDAQSWVEWKYVDVIDSIKWIRTEMTKEYNE